MIYTSGKGLSEIFWSGKGYMIYHLETNTLFTSKSQKKSGQKLRPKTCMNPVLYFNHISLIFLMIGASFYVAFAFKVEINMLFEKFAFYF